MFLILNCRVELRTAGWKGMQQKPCRTPHSDFWVYQNNMAAHNKQIKALMNAEILRPIQIFNQ